MSTLVGMQLNGRYRLDAQIGAGGMSTVYRAFDSVLERRVAVKLMHREIAADTDQLERFRREARSVAQLSHPHIVGVIDAGEEDGRPYIVFEYVEGETLKDRIRRMGRLPIDVLKIDRSLVERVDVEPQRQEVIRAIDQIATRLGLDTIVEGIEREAQRTTLLDLGFTPEMPPGPSALHFAAGLGRMNLVRRLVEAGASTEAVDDRFHETPLAWAERISQRLGGSAAPQASGADWPTVIEYLRSRSPS